MNAGLRHAVTDATAADLDAFERHVRDRAIRELRPDAVVIERVGRVTAAAYRDAMDDASVRAGASSSTGSDEPRWSPRPRSASPGPTPWRRAVERGSRRPSVARRGVLIAACAAALSIASVAGPAWVFASESVPGHALYGVRIAAETIGLEAIGTPGRAAAEARRLGSRVEELRDRAGRGDWTGAAAALAAAEAQAADVERALAAAPGARHAVREALTGARADLEVLERDRELPGEIRAGERALERELHRGILGRDTR